MELLKGNQCPTCLREWQSPEKIAELEKVVTDSEDRLRLITEAENRLPIGIEAENQYKAQQMAVMGEGSSYAAVLDKARQELQGITFKVSELNMKKQNAAQQVAQLQQLETAKKQVIESIAAESFKLGEIDGKLTIERAIHGSLGRQGYLGSIFDEILDEISEEVNDVISTIPNVNSVSIRFVSESETKSGKIKRSIAPMVTKDGIEAPLRTLSGGQQSSLELAVDLAIGNVIRRRTGRTPGWLVLDEAFDGMDLPTKETCMELLSRYASERLILIVDHTTEVKEGFDKSIRVTLANGLSKIA
jgi:exonuclease SbcC